MIVAFVPCRLKSSRLPNKAIREINGVSSIERCLLNTSAITKVDKVFLATSNNPEDDILARHTLDGTVELLRGSEEDVLERVMPAIEKYKPDYVLRITGDCPLVSYEMADYLINIHIESRKDVTITNSPTAIGLNSEIYTTAALLKLREYMPHTYHSEYLIWYFLNNPDLFSVNQVPVNEKYIQNWRLTLDEQNDLDLFNNIFKYLDAGKRPVSFDEVVHFFRENPEAVSINSQISVKYKDNQELIKILKQSTTIPLL